MIVNNTKSNSKIEIKSSSEDKTFIAQSGLNLLKLLKRMSRKFFGFIYSLNYKYFALAFIFVLAFVVYFKFIGFGIEHRYKLISWNDNPVATVHYLNLDQDDIQAYICGDIIGKYKATDETKILIATLNVNDIKSCDPQIENMHAGFAYGLSSGLTYDKSFNKLTLSDVRRGNVFIFKKL